MLGWKLAIVQDYISLILEKKKVSFISTSLANESSLLNTEEPKS